MRLLALIFGLSDLARRIKRNRSSLRRLTADWQLVDSFRQQIDSCSTASWQLDGALFDSCSRARARGRRRSGRRRLMNNGTGTRLRGSTMYKYERIRKWWSMWFGRAVGKKSVATLIVSMRPRLKNQSRRNENRTELLSLDDERRNGTTSVDDLRQKFEKKRIEKVVRMFFKPTNFLPVVAQSRCRFRSVAGFIFP